VEIQFIQNNKKAYNIIHVNHHHTVVLSLNYRDFEIQLSAESPNHFSAKVIENGNAIVAQNFELRTGESYLGTSYLSPLTNNYYKAIQSQKKNRDIYDSNKASRRKINQQDIDRTKTKKD